MCILIHRCPRNGAHPNAAPLYPNPAPHSLLRLPQSPQPHPKPHPHTNIIGFHPDNKELDVNKSIDHIFEKNKEWVAEMKEKNGDSYFEENVHR